MLGTAGAAAVADWFAVHRRRTWLEYACKPAVPALLVFAAVALHPVDEPRRAAFVVALVLSLVGDVLLMLPRDLFTLGLGAFLLAHVAYIAGLRREGTNPAALAGGAGGAALAIALVGTRVVLGITRGGRRALVGPVVTYMGVLAAMVVLAVATLNPVAGAGAGLFFCSDALLAWNRFLRPVAAGPLAVIVTYHVAQALLVLSLLR